MLFFQSAPACGGLSHLDLISPFERPVLYGLSFSWRRSVHFGLFLARQVCLEVSVEAAYVEAEFSMLLNLVS
jgi:hypothetical protein